MNFNFGPVCILTIFAGSAVLLQFYIFFLALRPNEELKHLPRARFFYLVNSYLLTFRTVRQIPNHGLSSDSVDWVEGIQRSMGGAVVLAAPLVVAALWGACRFLGFSQLPCWTCL